MSTDGDKILAAARIGAARPKSYYARAWRSTDQTMTAATVDYVAFDKSETTDGGGVYDRMSMHDPVGDPTRFFARVRGLYRLYTLVETDTDVGATGWLGLSVSTASGSYLIARMLRDASASNVFVLKEHCALDPNDAVRVEVFNAAGTTRTIISTARVLPVFRMELIESEHG